MKPLKTEEELLHYGTPRHSGRYPWGSGKDPYQRNANFLAYVDKLEKQGMKQTDIAKSMGMNSSQLRAKKSIARDENLKADIQTATKLKAKGWSNIAIGKRLGINESQVRAILEPEYLKRREATFNVANVLKEEVEAKTYIQVGEGIERYLGVAQQKLKTSLALLQEQGYGIFPVQVRQMSGKAGQNTTVKVLAKIDGRTNKEIYRDIYEHLDKIEMPTDVKPNESGDGIQRVPLKDPVAISQSRIQIRYGDQGGLDRDGLIEIRRGVDDISLGKNLYAQVRIGVEGNLYLKGMAVYSDDLPDGVDIRFNTNKKSGTAFEDVLKPMKPDPDTHNPFGASIRQGTYFDKDGNEHQSAINIVNEEGDWKEWSKTLSSQFLSKQPVKLAEQQLRQAYDIRKEEFDEIMALTNPTVKQTLLSSFAEDCDAAAVHLKAASMPRQCTHVILPVTSLRENEIYAPNYNDGDIVVLIRHPHGGIFEIPELVVNNHNPEAKKMLGNAKDAVGIHPKAAEKLSGADFDGDTALVIPNNDRRIKTMPSLKGLEGFADELKTKYAYHPGVKPMSERTKGLEMGVISNLITDMTIKGATPDELCRAVRHSMVVIDAYKHKLDYQQSYIDNGIAELKEKYQGGGGASTLISRSKGEYRVNARAEIGIDPVTGEKLYRETGKTYSKPIKNNKGEIIGWKKVPLQQISSNMAEAKDARELSSGTLMEDVYAEHANRLKALGNTARKELLATPNLEWNRSLKDQYAKELASLNAKLNIAEKNKPLERKAQILANVIFAAKLDANPDMEESTKKKERAKCLNSARAKVGAHKDSIIFTEKEWEAVQAGAISHTTLKKMLLNADMDRVKQLCMPKEYVGLSPARVARARSMQNQGRTAAEIAEALGVSTTTLYRALEAEENS